MIAPALASCSVPQARMVVTTVGSPTGIAAMAKATAASKTAMNVSPLARFSAIDVTSAMPAITRICPVSRSIWRVSGVLTACSSASMPEIRPTSVAIPVAVTTNSPAPRVTLVFMYVMSVRSPSGVSAPCHRLGALGGRQALPRQRGLVDLQRGRRHQPPVRGHDIARLDRDDIAGNQLRGGDLRQLAVPPHLGRDDYHLLQRGDGRGRLPFLVQPLDRVEQRQQNQQDARSELLERVEAADAGRQQHELHRVAVLPEEGVPAGLGRPAANSFGPNRLVRSATSAELRPRCPSTPSERRT